MDLPRVWQTALAKAEVVSFDIFDTAILRAVMHPVDVFLQVALEYGLADPAGFSRQRIAAEKEARDRAWRACGATEITLANIYEVLAEIAGFDSEESASVLATERQVERRQCRRNPAIGDFFDAAQRQGKRVGFISDMYLDEALIREILADAGYVDYDFFYLSCQQGLTKATGKLFALALADFGVSAAQVLHVGDNREADVKRAQAAGMQSIYYEKCGTRLLGDKRLATRLGLSQTAVATTCAADKAGEAFFSSVWHGLAAAHKHQHRSGGEGPEAFWQDLGYLYVGPLLLGFSLWLAESLRSNQTERVYFLARDGHVMKRVYDRLHRAGWADAEAHYLYASRRALNVPAIERIDDESSDFLVSGTSRLTVGQFLSRVGLDPVELSDEIAAAGFSDAQHRVLSGEDYGRLRALFRHAEPKLLRNTEQERAALAEYFANEGLLSPGQWAIADIGWHGSLQQSLERLCQRFGGQGRVPGYYLGTFAGAQRHIERGAQHRGYLCELGQPTEMLQVIRASVEVFEWIFSAPHGSVVRLEKQSDGVNPVFENAAFERERQITAGLMQNSALAFVDDFLSLWARPVPCQLPPQLVVCALAGLLHAPTRREATLLGNLPHVEGFGDVQVSRPIARPGHSLLNPFRLKHLADQYRGAFWRAGFRRRLNPFA